MSNLVLASVAGIVGVVSRSINTLTGIFPWLSEGSCGGFFAFSVLG